MQAIDNLTRAEKINLINQLQKDIGWYPLLVLCIEDVRNHLEDLGDDMPSDEALRQSCAYVYRKWDGGDLWNDAVHWASEICEKV